MEQQHEGEQEQEQDEEMRGETIMFHWDKDEVLSNLYQVRSITAPGGVALSNSIALTPLGSRNVSLSLAPGWGSPFQ